MKNRQTGRDFDMVQKRLGLRPSQKQKNGSVLCSIVQILSSQIQQEFAAEGKSGHKDYTMMVQKMSAKDSRPKMR